MSIATNCIMRNIFTTYSVKVVLQPFDKLATNYYQFITLLDWITINN